MEKWHPLAHLVVPCRTPALVNVGTLVNLHSCSHFCAFSLHLHIFTQFVSVHLHHSTQLTIWFRFGPLTTGFSFSQLALGHSASEILKTSAAGRGRPLSVSICTLVLVKPVNWVPVRGCQYLYIFASKASNLSTWERESTLSRAPLGTCRTPRVLGLWFSLGLTFEKELFFFWWHNSG